MNNQDADIPPLCDVCQTLDLSRTNNREAAEYPLGTWEDVKRKAKTYPSCPSCVLLFAFRSTLAGSFETEQASVEWKKKGGFFFGYEGDNLAFLNEDTATSPYGCARAVQSHIDPALVRKWIKLCEDHHEETCTPKRGVIRASESEVGVKVLRLIDTEDQCIVEAAPGDRYLALSYVWGPVVASVRLEQKKVAEMSVKGALGSLREGFPKTISDAIDLVQLIGERYLWVDSLCLIQDDGDDMLDGISHMDMIYQCAILTIIAAHGDDANAGLSGLHCGSRNVSQGIMEVLPGIKLTATTGVYNAMSGLHNTRIGARKYSTRGWTQQELVLSYRTLIFSKDRIYFRCRANCWSEDTIYDNFPSAINEVLHSGSMIEFLADNEPEPIPAYNSQLFRYADRKLTKESDTLHAFTGILRFLSVQCRSGLLEGLFTASFDISLLCWDCYLGFIEPVRREGFPSWSWAGWPGIRDGYGRFCKNPDFVNTWLQTQTYIVWYKRSAETCELELVWNLDLQLKHGKPDEHYIGYRSDLDDPYGRTKDLSLENLKTRPNDEDVDRANIIREEMNRRKYHFLHFFAYTVFIQGFSKPPETKVHTLLGAGGTTCGGIQLNNSKLMDKVDGPHELVLLSKMDKYEAFFNDSITFERPFYWVMLIVWVEKNKVVAERRGLGFLFQDCLEHVLPPGKVWREIVLA